MLCACVQQGWDVRTYLRPDHPLQQRVLQLVADTCGVRSDDVEVAIDGCGVPTFGMPLAAFALAFARLAKPDQLRPDACEAATAVRDAMVGNPGMVAGEGRFDTRLMEAMSGRVLAKAGAEACQALALIDRGWGVALKIEDGGARAVGVAALEVLRQLDGLDGGQLAALADLARPPVRNYRDEIVGEARPLFSLQPAS
jgi:L-asparaginase II